MSVVSEKSRRGGGGGGRDEEKRMGGGEMGLRERLEREEGRGKR